jgi:cell division septation protein DedD
MKLILLAFVVPLSLFASSVIAQDVKNGLYVTEHADFAGALEIWRPLAERGDANAQHQLGIMYYFGIGVPRNYSEALEWQLLAAAQGHAKAQNNLAVMYAYGEGVPQNHVVSAVLYRLSAERGYSVAQYNLGTMYESGVGIKQDYEEAYMWYTLASEQEYEAAKLASISLGHRISVEQKNAALARIQNRQESEGQDPIREPAISADSTSPSRRVVEATREDTLSASLGRPTTSPREKALAAPHKDTLSTVNSQPTKTAVQSLGKTTGAKSLAGAGSKPWRIQLASLRNQTSAQAEWKKLQKAQDLLQGLKLHVQQAKLSKGTFYRVQAGPLTDRTTAVSLCNSLKSRKQDCLIVSP